MARSQSSGALKIAGAVVAVVAGGAAFGYLFGSVRDAHPGIQPVPTPVSSTLTPPPSVIPSSIHPHTNNGNYTAPGAPRIDIEEEHQPIIHRVTTPPAPAPDPEATQEAAPVTSRPVSSESTPTDTPRAAPSDPSTTPEVAPGANSSPSPAASAPTSPPPTPSDPDFEHLNTPKPAPNTADPEAGQQGGNPGSAQNNSGLQFRVQTGAYTDESNARSVADTLRSQGFNTSTRSERDGDHLVYKVQVGAYRSKNGADKAAGDLQKKGYSAFISPMTP